jgi:hypothetical protein
MKTGGIITTSFLISIIAVSTLGYFVGPMIFPNLAPPAFEKIESNTAAKIEDYELTWVEIPNSTLNITIREGSRISTQFSGSYIMVIAQVMSTIVSFEMSVVITGVGNCTQYFFYYRSFTEGGIVGVGGTYYIQYITEPLPQGEYESKVFYRSMDDNTGQSYVLLSNGNYNYTRTLTALEIL